MRSERFGRPFIGWIRSRDTLVEQAIRNLFSSDSVCRLMLRGHNLDAEWTKARLEALSDGVFAIAMTILVFNIKLPDELRRGSSEHDVLQAVANTWPQLMAYMISFIILGAMWMGHHNVFHALRKIDRGTIWLNLFYLLWVCLMPFSTSVYSFHLSTKTGLMAYWINVFLAGVFLALLWYSVSRKSDLLSTDITPALKKNITVRTWVMPIVSLAAMGGTLISPSIGLYSTWILPLAYRVAMKITNKRMESASDAEKSFDQAGG